MKPEMEDAVAEFDASGPESICHQVCLIYGGGPNKFRQRFPVNRKCEHQVDIGIPCDLPAVVWHAGRNFLTPRCKKHAWEWGEWGGISLSEEELLVLEVQEE
jgi:hypothetical protein